MVKCKQCGEIFGRRTTIDGKKIDLGNRRAYCLKCHQYKPRQVIADVYCLKCNEKIPGIIYESGMIRRLYGRKYCLKCSPVGSRHFCGPKPKQPDEQIKPKTDYSRQKRFELKKKGVNYLGGKCKICGYAKNYASLLFHHKDSRDKEFNIGGAIVSWERLKKELDKCDLICSNCHNELHNPDYEIK